MLNFVLGSKIRQASGRTLDASVQRVGDVVLIRLKGRVTSDGGDVALRELILDAVDRGDRKILLDLSKVSFIASSGIGELVATYKDAKERGAAVRLCSLSDNVCSIFQTVQLLQVFDVRENEKEGLAAFVATT